MPYFHSAINVFKWLLLSSGFDAGSEDYLLKIEETKQKSRHWLFFCVSSGSEMRYRSEAVQTGVNSSSTQLYIVSCISSAAQWVAAASRQP